MKPPVEGEQKEAISEKVLTMINKQVLLTLPVLSKRALLEEHERTKVVIRFKNLLNSAYPAFDTFHNQMLVAHLAPPSDLTKVAEWWNTLAGTTLTEPSISSKNFRTQTIEFLNPADVSLDKHTAQPTLIYKNQSFETLTSVLRSKESSSGQTTINLAFTEFEKFRPVQLEKTIKERKVFVGNAASVLTKLSTEFSAETLCRSRISRPQQ